MQSQLGAMARAFELRLATETKSFLAGDNNLPFSAKYPNTAAIYKELMADGWQIVSQNTALQDYGVSEYNNRMLEQAFAISHVKLRNRSIGVYKELCLVTGFVSDTEFKTEREPFESECDGMDLALARRN